jgi:hypothetical protein
MAAHGRKTRSDELLAAGLAAGQTIESAAKAAGVSERTARRRMSDPGFMALVDRYQDRLLEQFVGGAADRLSRALSRLDALIDHPNGVVALSACRTVIDATLKVREAVTLARRVAELERVPDEPTDPSTEVGDAAGGHADGPAGSGSDPHGPGPDHADGGDGAGPLAT